MPRYRVHVANGTEESAFEENFADEAQARQRLAKRGWTRVIAIGPPGAPAASAETQAAAPAGAASGAHVPPHDPEAAMRKFSAEAKPLRTVGEWAYLDAATAARHPLHGLGGWLIAFLIWRIFIIVLAAYVISALLPAFALEMFEILGILGVVMMVAIVLIVLDFVAVLGLVLGSRWFPALFYVVAGLYIVAAVLGMVDNQRPFREVGQILWHTVGIVYVVRSRRVNVTFRHRVNVREIGGAAPAGT